MSAGDAESRRRRAQSLLDRINEDLRNLGPLPPIGTRAVTHHVEQGLVYKDRIPVQREVPDSSAQMEYREKIAVLQMLRREREAALQAIIDETEKKRGVMLSAEMAEKKLQANIDKLSREIQASGNRVTETLEKQAETAYGRLKTLTERRVSAAREGVEQQLNGTITQAFDANLELLRGLVKAKYLGPVEEKKEMLADISRQLSEGHARIKARQAELESIQKDLRVVMENTKDLEKSVHGFYQRAGGSP